MAQSAKSISPTLSYGMTALLHSEHRRRNRQSRGVMKLDSKPMQCECLVDQPNQGLVRCPSKATQRLTISHLKIRLLVCEACGARQLAWAEPYRSLPGLVVVEPGRRRLFDCCPGRVLVSRLAGAIEPRRTDQPRCHRAPPWRIVGKRRFARLTADADQQRGRPSASPDGPRCLKL